MNTLAKRILFAIIRGYQRFISPLLPARCRYYPTCSNYGLQAVAWHGAWRGGWLATKRICSCHPLGGHGIDFVPLPLYRFTFQYLSSPSQLNGVNGINGVYVTQSDYTAHLNMWLNGKSIAE